MEMIFPDVWDELFGEQIFIQLESILTLKLMLTQWMEEKES